MQQKICPPPKSDRERGREGGKERGERERERKREKDTPSLLLGPNLLAQDVVCQCPPKRWDLSEILLWGEAQGTRAWTQQGLAPEHGQTAAP